jgi:hypothetical protein
MFIILSSYIEYLIINPMRLELHRGTAHSVDRRLCGGELVDLYVTAMFYLAFVIILGVFLRFTGNSPVQVQDKVSL